MLCLCAPSTEITEIRTSSGTTNQPLFMLCHFHAFFFFYFLLLKLYFHPNFWNSQHRSSQVTPGRAWGKVGLQELWPLCLSRFSLCHLHLSEEIPSQIWNTEFTPLRAGTALFFLCRRENLPWWQTGWQLGKAEGFTSQTRSQNEKRRFGTTKTPLWTQSKHHPWHKTRNSELLYAHGIKQGILNYLVQSSKEFRITCCNPGDFQAKQRNQEMAEFPFSHPLGVALQQNSNEVV